MGILDTFAATQTRRLVHSLLVSIIFSVGSYFLYHFIFRELIQKLPASFVYKTNLKLAHSMLFILLILFLGTNLALLRRYSLRHAPVRVSYSLKHAIICFLGASVLVGLNALPFHINKAFPDEPLRPMLEIVSYGFPKRIYWTETTFTFNGPGPETQTHHSIMSAVQNGLILILFVANVLALTFVKSETASSAPVSAPHNASH